jgi:hypothetical protein
MGYGGKCMQVPRMNYADPKNVKIGITDWSKLFKMETWSYNRKHKKVY